MNHISLKRLDLNRWWTLKFWVWHWSLDPVSVFTTVSQAIKKSILSRIHLKILIFSIIFDSLKMIFAIPFGFFGENEFFVSFLDIWSDAIERLIMAGYKYYACNGWTPSKHRCANIKNVYSTLYTQKHSELSPIFCHPNISMSPFLFT